MGWLQKRKAINDLKKMNIPGLDVDGMVSDLQAGMKEAEQVRDQMRKLESPAYDSLIKKINEISYSTMSVKSKYESSLVLINDTELSNYEHNDLINQVEGMYEELLTVREYIQVISTLNLFRKSEFPKHKKISLSIKLIQDSNITDNERAGLMNELKKLYKL